MALFPAVGEAAPDIRFTHTIPQRYDVDRNIINEREKVIAGADYSLKKWSDGKWQAIETFPPEGDSIELENLSRDTLYWMVKK